MQCEEWYHHDDHNSCSLKPNKLEGIPTTRTPMWPKPNTCSLRQKPSCEITKPIMTQTPPNKQNPFTNTTVKSAAGPKCLLFFSHNPIFSLQIRGEWQWPPSWKRKQQTSNPNKCVRCFLTVWFAQLIGRTETTAIHHPIWKNWWKSCREREKDQIGDHFSSSINL